MQDKRKRLQAPRNSEGPEVFPSLGTLQFALSSIRYLILTRRTGRTNGTPHFTPSPKSDCLARRFNDRDSHHLQVQLTQVLRQAAYHSENAAQMIEGKAVETNRRERRFWRATTFGGLLTDFMGGYYDGWWSERLMPSFSIRWRSVLGCRFKIIAAPFGPSITPEVSLRAATI